MKNIFTILITLLSINTFADVADDMHTRITNENAEKQRADLAKYKADHPDWSKRSEPYLQFQIQQEEETYQLKQTKLDFLCTTYKKYCFDDAYKKADVRDRDFYIAQLNDDFSLLKKLDAKEITSEERDRLHAAFFIDYLKNECENFQRLCEVFNEKKLSYKENYKVEYGATVAPGAGSSVAPSVTPKPEVKNKVVVAQTGSFKSETCKWVSDMPRRLVFGPGCDGGRNAMVCTGFVVCDSNDEAGGKFIRQSTCGSANCSDDKAVACTKQANFGSCKPEDETKTGISQRTTDALTIED